MDPFPEDVRRFIDRNIESIDQLEILRVLGENPAREWSAAELAAAVQAERPVIEGHLAALHSRGLLTSEKRGAETFGRYGPQSPELEAIVAKLLQQYRERPVSMIKLVYARAKDTLRSFSDAFRIRKGEG